MSALSRFTSDSSASSLAGLGPTSRGVPLSYPRQISLFESSKAYQPPTRSPSKTPHPDSFSSMTAYPTIDIKSSSHSRSLVLVVLRILLQATSVSLFLAEYRPLVIDLLLSTWPCPGSFRPPDLSQHTSLKGKGRDIAHDDISEVQEVFLVEWLGLIEVALCQSVGGLRSREYQIFAQRMLDCLEMRLVEAAYEIEEARMDVDDPREDRRKWLHERIDKTLFNFIVKVSQGVLFCPQSNAAHSEVRQLFGRFVATEAPSLIRALFDETPSLHIRACSLVILAAPLCDVQPPVSDPSITHSSSSSTSPLDVLPISTLRQLDQNLQKHAECPLDLSSLSSSSFLRSAFALLQSDYDSRTSIRTERDAAIEAQTANTTEAARKRRTIGAPASDGLTGIEEIPGSTAKRRRKISGHSKDVAGELLAAMAKRAATRGDGRLKQALEEGEKFEPFDSKISRLVS